MWCIAERTSEYVAKMEDVLAVYERPYDRQEPVVCLDEKPVSLHADKRPARPARPGHLAKRDTEYERCGTANIFALAVRDLIAAYPRTRTLHLVLDNLSTYRESSLITHLGRHLGQRLWRRLTVHYTPLHGSRLNQAEIELSLVARRCLGTRCIPALATLVGEVGAWNADANRRKTCINWRFTRKDARRKFGYTRPTSMRSET